MTREPEDRVAPGSLMQQKLRELIPEDDILNRSWDIAEACGVKLRFEVMRARRGADISRDSWAKLARFLGVET